jgi:lipopolysaccharide transport system permease protein
MPEPSARAQKVTRIEARRGLALPDFHELYEARELLYVLAWRDVKVRYKQTVLGAAWALIQPLTSMVVFTLIFDRVGKVSSDNVPYPLFSLCGLVIWTYFSNGLVQASNSLVSNLGLLTKVYFPRLFIPLGSLLAGAVDLAIAMVVLFGVMVGYGVWPGLRIVAILPVLLLAALTTAGLSAWLGALNVRFRDVRYIVTFFVQIWLLATPVAWPASSVSPGWRTLLGLNPMAGVVEGFRWAAIGTNGGIGGMMIVSTISAMAVFVLGVGYFIKVERRFADVA